MPENKGFYQKYNVSRVDGKPIEGPTFTLEFSRDPHAIPALKAYAASCRETLPQLADDLDRLIGK